MILASGAEKRRLEIPGEDKYAGRGVVYCSTCDGPFYRQKTIAIVGGGSSALEAAVEMSGIAKKVHVVSRGPWSGEEWLKDKAGAAPGVRPLIGYEPVEILGDEVVDRLVIRDIETRKLRTLLVDGVFIEVGLSPNSDLVLDLARTNQRGEVIVDEWGDTGIRGVFAAGDVTANKDERIVDRRRRGREGRVGGVRLSDLAALRARPASRPDAGLRPSRCAQDEVDGAPVVVDAMLEAADLVALVRVDEVVADAAARAKRLRDLGDLPRRAAGSRAPPRSRSGASTSSRWLIGE